MSDDYKFPAGNGVVEDRVWLVSGTLRWNLSNGKLRNRIKVSRMFPRSTTGVRIRTGKIIRTGVKDPTDEPDREPRAIEVYWFATKLAEIINPFHNKLEALPPTKELHISQFEDLLILPNRDEIPNDVRKWTSRTELLVVRRPRNTDTPIYRLICLKCLGELEYIFDSSEAASFRFDAAVASWQTGKPEVTDGASHLLCNRCLAKYDVPEGEIEHYS